MKETLKSFLNKYGIRILIVIMSMLFLCTYVARKEGFHMDEVLAYQLANAEYNPWIVPTQPVGRLAKFMAEHIDGDSFLETISNVSFIVKDTLSNKGNSILANYKADVYEAPVWMSREMFQNYVQTNRTDDFNLASVYFNVKDDNHPPLHFMLLHIMSSIFKSDMSAWIGCFINLVAIAGILWLMGLIGERLFQNKYSAYASMILFGFSFGAVATALWIRMYALLTLFVVWNLYLHLLEYGYLVAHDTSVKNEKNKFVEWKIFWVTVLSFWTQYFVLFFLIPLAIVTFVNLVSQKSIQKMWVYIRTMMLAAVVGICVYPFAIGDVLFSSRGTEAISTWKNGLADYANRLWSFANVLGQNVSGSVWMFVAIAVVPVLLTLLLHKEHLPKFSTNMSRKWLFVIVPTIAYFLLAAKMSPFFVDRYVMAIFPMLAICIIGIWNYALGNKKYFAVTIIALTILTNTFVTIQTKGEHPYLYTGYAEQVDVAKEYADYPMVCLYPGLSFYENVMEMEVYRETILLKEEELSLMTVAHTDETKDGYVALIKFPQDNNGAVQLERVMQVFGGTKATLLHTDGPFGDALYLVEP